MEHKAHLLHFQAVVTFEYRSFHYYFLPIINLMMSPSELGPSRSDQNLMLHFTID